MLIGSVPSETVDEKCSEKIKLAIMEYLNRQYGMVEADFLSAELCCVPAFKACDIGFDRSFVGSYGHDDRVCSYTGGDRAARPQGDAHPHLRVPAGGQGGDRLGRCDRHAVARVRHIYGRSVPRAGRAGGGVL